MTDLEKIQDQLNKAMDELKTLEVEETELAYDYIEYANILVKKLILHGVVSSKNKPEIQQAHAALKAITAWRQLDGLNLLSDSEKYEIKERIMVLYGKYLSPIRTEQ